MIICEVFRSSRGLF